LDKWQLLAVHVANGRQACVYVCICRSVFVYVTVCVTVICCDVSLMSLCAGWCSISWSHWYFSKSVGLKWGKCSLL